MKSQDYWLAQDIISGSDDVLEILRHKNTLRLLSEPLEHLCSIAAGLFVTLI